MAWSSAASRADSPEADWGLCPPPIPPSPCRKRQLAAHASRLPDTGSAWGEVEIHRDQTSARLARATDGVREERDLSFPSNGYWSPYRGSPALVTQELRP